MHRRSQRGVTLIESMIAMGVMLVGLLGMAHMQVLAVRSNAMAQKMTVASGLAADFAQNVARWNFDDARLTPTRTVTAFTDAAVLVTHDLGSNPLVQNTPARPQFSEDPADLNAANAGSLGSYEGATTDIDKDGKPDLQRYWTVFAYDPDSDGTANGKMVVIVIRWKEPGYGFRQVVMTTFKLNPAVLSL